MTESGLYSGGSVMQAASRCSPEVALKARWRPVVASSCVGLEAEFGSVTSNVGGAVLDVVLRAELAPQVVDTDEEFGVVRPGESGAVVAGVRCVVGGVGERLDRGSQVVGGDCSSVGPSFPGGERFEESFEAAARIIVERFLPDLPDL